MHIYFFIATRANKVHFFILEGPDVYFPLLVFPSRGHQQKIKTTYTDHPFVVFLKFHSITFSLGVSAGLWRPRDGTPTTDKVFLGDGF